MTYPPNEITLTCPTCLDDVAAFPADRNEDSSYTTDECEECQEVTHRKEADARQAAATHMLIATDYDRQDLNRGRLSWEIAQFAPLDVDSMTSEDAEGRPVIEVWFSKGDIRPSTVHGMACKAGFLAQIVAV